MPLTLVSGQVDTHAFALGSKSSAHLWHAPLLELIPFGHVATHVFVIGLQYGAPITAAICLHVWQTLSLSCVSGQADVHLFPSQYGALLLFYWQETHFCAAESHAGFLGSSSAQLLHL